MKTKTQNSKRIPAGPFSIIPMRNMVLYPGQTMPVVVGRPRSRRALEAALARQSEWVVLVAQKNDHVDEEPKSEDLYKVGVLARIDRSEGGASQGYQLILTGIHRFQIDNYEEGNGGYLLAHGDVLEDVHDVDAETLTGLTGNMKQIASEIFELLPGNLERLANLVKAVDDPILLSHLVAQNLDLKLVRKQELLEMVSLRNRLLALLDQMAELREQLKLQRDVNQKLSSRLGKQHRDAILREQIRTMQEELGEKPSGGSDFQQKIKDAKMPEDVEKIALEQLQRMEAVGQQSPESHVIRNYLDLLVALPWSISSENKIDLESARRVLEEDHYGLEKIKKRILQHLAVLKLKEKKGSILLFVGPPGVGKTSLGKSIARAMGRKFVRVSLGGVRDDAEIRGHRRTYVGALPGRIVDGIKRAGENNPVFMLDEIDKMTRGYGGDPAASMLEVLDPEQNAKFVDHYLDLAFDLSNVFFIATANTTETIPPPLLDRMEVIYLSGYTTAEKLHISRTHLVPKQLDEHGVKSGQLEVSEAAQLRMITAYTREAGVRELQRVIGSSVRASTERVLNAAAEAAATDARPELIKVDIADLEEILGPEKFMQEIVSQANPPGVVTGLAWTPLGGEILFIESSHMPGKGQLMLTGQLGEVMRESAQIAMTLVRSRLAGTKHPFAYDREDIHLHVPAGAIPKDGPSAGVAMLSTIASLILNRPVSSKLAMTGEITLRGAIMPVGGIKEKVIAAHRAGIEKVVLPKKNERDLKEVPEEVRQSLEFLFADTVEEALHHTLGLEAEQWSSLASPISETLPSADCH